MSDETLRDTILTELRVARSDFELTDEPSGSHVTRKTFGHDAEWVKVRSGDWKMEDTVRFSRPPN